MLPKKLQKRIQDRIEKGTLRSLSSFEGIDFISNDYLGLSSFDVSGNDEGSTGSRLISGNRKSTEEAEERLASFFGGASGLCFNSGYDANLGVFSSIPQRGDRILFDEAIHASVRDGMRLSLANSHSFNHNDAKDLKRLLDKPCEGTTYIAVEALYSMHGDMAPLRSIVELTKEADAKLIVDEAHSAGVYGKDGRGLVHALDLEADVFIRLVTFGKAYGGHGAVVLADKDVNQYLMNFARSFIYTTALPSASYMRMEEVVHHDDLNDRRFKLMDNIQCFRENIELDVVSEVNSPIQMVRLGNVDDAYLIQEELNKVGIDAKAVFSPTVKEGEESVRVCIHSFNTIAEIQSLTSILNEFKS